MDLRPLTRSLVAMDIGGSLCKLCYFETHAGAGGEAERVFREKVARLIDSPEPYGENGKRDVALEFESPQLGGKIHLMHFPTASMLSFLDMVKENQLVNEQSVICSTGGGAEKFAKVIHERLGVEIRRADEFACLTDGIAFLLQREDMPELYMVDHATYRETGERIVKPFKHTSSPYLLVNIGSGVSMLKVFPNGRHERVGGTSLGGATFFGLCALLTGCQSFSAALKLADEGEASNVDLLVSDIYGGDYSAYDLPGSTVAASLGKLISPEVRATAKKEDLARAVLDAITNNIGSLALLHARAHHCSIVAFAGNFLRDNRLSVARLSYAMEYWSKGQQEAMFFLHEGYLGALGALIHSDLENSKIASSAATRRSSGATTSAL
eukprot:m.37472 g.37472  ORF g.37472 m.37472 type:complete len:382 (-) comp5838_c0_seq2:325-1470(-)